MLKKLKKRGRLNLKNLDLRRTLKEKGRLSQRNLELVEKLKGKLRQNNFDFLKNLDFLKKTIKEKNS